MQFDLQEGAVENAVYESFGDKPFAEIQEKKSRLLGNKKIASKGAMGIRIRRGKSFIFVNMHPAIRGERLTLDGAREAALNCLVEVDKLDYGDKSIVFPALGNGIWGLPLADSVKAIAIAAKMYVDGVKNENMKPSLLRIEVVLYQPGTKDKKEATDSIRAFTN